MLFSKLPSKNVGLEDGALSLCTIKQLGCKPQSFAYPFAFEYRCHGLADSGGNAWLTCMYSIDFVSLQNTICYNADANFVECEFVTDSCVGFVANFTDILIESFMKIVYQCRGSFIFRSSPAIMKGKHV